MELYKKIEAAVIETASGDEDVHIRYFKKYRGSQVEVRFESYEGGISAGAYVTVAGFPNLLECYMTDIKAKKCKWIIIDRGMEFAFDPKSIPLLMRDT